MPQLQQPELPHNVGYSTPSTTCTAESKALIVNVNLDMMVDEDAYSVYSKDWQCLL